MTGPEHTYTQAQWLTQWAMDLLSHTGTVVILSIYAQLAQGTCEGTFPGAVVILRDQAEVKSCAWYDYIPHRVPTESSTDEHHQVEP